MRSFAIVIRNLFNLYLPILILLISIGCSDNSIYRSKNKIDNEAWSSSQILKYSWTIDDTINWYQISLKIEHGINLDYRNIYVKCITSFPDGDKKEQVLSLELFNEIGNPYGSCSSSSCNTEIPLIAKTKFPFPGDYQLSIEQFGRDTIIQGLQSFELSLKPADLLDN